MIRTWWIHKKCKKTAVTELSTLGLRCLWCGVRILSFDEVEKTQTSEPKGGPK